MPDEVALIRVVIVDDHPMILESLHRLLAEKDSGIEVVGAEMTGQAGIDRVHLERPDVVIMDLGLPDMDGAVAAGQMLADYPELKIIILTGSEIPGGYADAIAVGCAAWVRKTRAVHDLTAAVHEVHDRRRVTIEVQTGVPSKDDLVVHYQPILNLESLAIVGFEALVRWQHPERGLLGPAMFLPLAEETGFSSEIGTIVAHQALIDLRAFKKVSNGLFMNVDLSAPGLNSVGVADAISEILNVTDTEPFDLILDVTETALVEETPLLASNLLALKAAGVRLALDDFGTAFSSLALARRLPFSYLKIDPSFVADLPNTSRSVLLMEAIQHFADSLGIGTIAEGIELPEQLECLRKARWTLGQGHLFSRAVSASKAAELLH